MFNTSVRGTPTVLATRRCIFGMLFAVYLAAFSGCQEPLPDKTSSSYEEPHSLRLDLGSPAGRRVLVVHSYHAAYPWTAAIDRGIHEILDGTGVEQKTFYMDTKRHTEEAWKKQAGEAAMAEVKAWQPDVVIATDDNAQAYFGRNLVDGPIPLVFCGVNADPAKYGYPAFNVTGIIERPMLDKNVRYAKRFVPVERLVILSSNDPTSLGAINFMREQHVDCKHVDFRLVETLQQWREQVRLANQDASVLAIYMYHTLTMPGEAESVDPGRVMSWTAENTTVPTIAFFEFGVTDGCLLGIVASGEEHGREAAHYAFDILQGTPVGNLPVIHDSGGKTLLNRTTARRLGIPLDSLDLTGIDVVEGE